MRFTVFCWLHTMHTVYTSCSIICLFASHQKLFHCFTFQSLLLPFLLLLFKVRFCINFNGESLRYSSFTLFYITFDSVWFLFHVRVKTVFLHFYYSYWTINFLFSMKSSYNYLFCLPFHALIRLHTTINFFFTLFATLLMANIVWDVS